VIPISAVIATHDRRELVARAIASALAQTAPAAEVIVVDDGSSDGTSVALELEFGARIRIVGRETAGGAAAARNAGVRAATSPWVAFLDDDDTWTPGHLERMAVAIATAETTPVLLFADARFPEGSATPSAFARAGLRVDGGHESLADGTPWVLRAHQPMMTPASVVSRQAYLAVGGMDEQLPCREDTHLFAALSIGAPVCAVAGYGVVVGGDAPVRLTTTHSEHDDRYWRATVRLYADLLARTAGAEPWAQAHVRHQLAVAHWRRARLAMRSRRPGRASAELARSARREPRLIADRVLARARA
jgi:glycosyltransferase involved in cell wall biosynthesis